METPLLHGEIVTWGKFRIAELTIKDVRTALEVNGLPLDVAHDLSNKSAFGRACKDLKKDRQIDKLKHEGGIYSFQLTQRAMQDGKLEFVFETIVTLHGETGKIECENTGIRLLAEELFKQAMIRRTAQDVTRACQKLFATKAELWPINPEKGVAYFVPNSFREFTAKVEGFVSALGGKLSRFPVPRGTPEGDASVKDAFESRMKADIDELTSIVESFDETTRDSTMESIAARYQAVQFKLQTYAEYTSDRVERVLAAAKAKLREKVVAVSDLKEKAKPKEAAVA